MGLEGCGKCMKYTLFVANVLIMIGGIVVLSVGIWVATDSSTFADLMDGHLLMSASYILIAAGCIVAIISVIGCLGAVREIKCLLLTYFIILFILFVIMLVGGILGAVYKNMVRDKLKIKMEETLTTEYGVNSNVNSSWDIVQEKFSCCGTKTSEFKGRNGNMLAWSQNSLFKKEKHGGEYRVPDSCCRKQDNGKIDVGKCQSNIDASVENENEQSKYIFNKDCADALAAAIEEHTVVLGAIGIAVACLLLFGMIFSLVLFMKIE